MQTIVMSASWLARFVLLAGLWTSIFVGLHLCQAGKVSSRAKGVIPYMKGLKSVKSSITEGMTRQTRTAMRLKVQSLIGLTLIRRSCYLCKFKRKLIISKSIYSPTNLGNSTETIWTFSQIA